MPKKNNLYPYREAFGKQEIKYLKSVISYYVNKKSDPPYHGIFEKKLSNEFSKFMNGGFALPVSSGTSAAYVAIQSLMLNSKSEILISPVNDSGPINAIINLNLKPIIIDSKKNSYNVSLDNIKNKISKKTKAVLLAHIGGQSAEIGKISNFLKKKKIPLIEDCSQAPGASCFQCQKRCKVCVNKKVGEFGNISFFSTMYRKSISSSGSGGIVFTKNKNQFRRIQSCGDRGKQTWLKINQNDPSKALFPALNHNTNEFASAVTLSSLKRLNETNNKRKKILKYLIKTLRKNSLVCKPSYFDNGFAPFFFPIEVDTKKLKISKLKFANYLMKKGVPLLPEYNCIVTKWPWAKKYFPNNFAARNAVNYSKKTFHLFFNEKFKKNHLDKIVKIIKKVENIYFK